MAQNQAYLFLVFSLTGVIIGILFDFFRILRRTIKTSNFITYLEDILFWILTGFLILYNIWYFNNGEIYNLGYSEKDSNQKSSGFLGKIFR